MDVLKFECPDYQVTISTASIDYAWDRFVRRVKNGALTYCEYLSSREGSLWLRKQDADKKELVMQNEEAVLRTEWPQLANINLLSSSSMAWMHPQKSMRLVFAIS